MPRAKFEIFTGFRAYGRLLESISDTRKTSRIELIVIVRQKSSFYKF